MIRFFYASAILFVLIFLNGCATRSDLKSANGQLLLFEDKEPGKKTSITRILVTDRYVRLDENFNAKTERDGSAYTLYDRLYKKLYFIDNSSLFTKQINLSDVKRIGDKPNWQVESEQSQATIRTSDDLETKATFYKFSLDGKLCYNVVALSPAMSEVYDAMREYRVAWAKYWFLIKKDAPEMDDPCFRAITVDDPEKILSYGFPTREWTPNGKQRFLVDFRTNIQFPGELFKTGWW